MTTSGRHFLLFCCWLVGFSFAVMRQILLRICSRHFSVVNVIIITFLGSQLNRFQSIALQAELGVRPTGPMAPHLFVWFSYAQYMYIIATTLSW
jgi:hypothetical protein